MSRLDPTPWQHAPPARGQPPNLNFQQLLASLPDYHQKWSSGSSIYLIFPIPKQGQIILKSIKKCPLDFKIIWPCVYCFKPTPFLINTYEIAANRTVIPLSIPKLTQIFKSEAPWNP
jgi:hypothetical protein